MKKRVLFLQICLLFGLLLVLAALTACHDDPANTTTATPTVTTYAPVTVTTTSVPKPVQHQPSFSEHKNSETGRVDYYTVSGYTGNSGPLEIPKTYNKIPVLAIAPGAFAGSTTLQHVVFEPDADIRAIGYRAFAECHALTTVTMNDHLLVIQERAFENCSALQSITVPDSVTGIGFAAFSGCTALVRLQIPFVGISRIDAGTNTADSTEKKIEDPIEKYAKTSLPLLSDYSGPNTLFGYIFGGREYNTALPVPEETTHQGLERTIETAGISITYQYRYDIPRSLRHVIVTDTDTLVRNAFAGCSQLETLVLPAGLKNVASDVFLGCQSLSVFSEDTEAAVAAFRWDPNYNREGIPVYFSPAWSRNDENIPVPVPAG